MGRWRVAVEHRKLGEEGGEVYLRVVDPDGYTVYRGDFPLRVRVFPLTWWERLIGLTPEQKAFRVARRFLVIADRLNRDFELSQQLVQAVQDHLYTLSQFREKV